MLMVKTSTQLECTILIFLMKLLIDIWVLLLFLLDWRLDVSFQGDLIMVMILNCGETSFLIMFLINFAPKVNDCL